MEKVYIRKSCGRGRIGAGYVIMCGRFTVDELTTDASHIDSVSKLPGDIKDDRRAAGGYNLIRAAVIAGDYAKRHNLTTTPFVARAAPAGAPLIEATDRAAAKYKEESGVVAALKNAAVLLNIDINGDSDEASHARKEIEAAEKKAEEASSALKRARAAEREKSAQVEELFTTFRSMCGDYAERKGEELPEPAPAAE